MKIKKFLLVLLFAFLTVTVVACGNKGGSDKPEPDNSEIIKVAEEELAKIDVTFAEGDSKTSVTKDVTLATSSVSGVTVTWASNNAAVTNTGKVTRGESDVEVTLTVTVKYQDVEKTKTVKVVVKGEEKVPEPTEVSTIAEALALESGNVRVNGTVVAVNAKGYYVWDGTGFIQVYVGSSDFTQKMGDYVDVEGPVAKYNNTNQFTSDAVVKALENGTEFTEAAEELDALTFEAYLANVALGKLVKVEVEVTSVSDSYVNALVKGSETFGVAIASPTADNKFEVGAKYLVTVFAMYAKDFKGVNYLYCFVNDAILTEAAPLPTYTVTFNTDGGSKVENIEFQDFNLVELPEPEKFGYFFLGWVDADGNTVEALTANKDYALKATWFEADCDLVIDLDGGKFSDGYLGADNKKHFDHAIYSYEIEIPTKDGKVFLGWMTSDGVVVNEFFGECEITAKWGDKLVVTLNCGPSNDLIDDIGAEFLKDFNAQTGKSLTKANFFSATYTAAGTPVVADFFADPTYGPKWSWLEDFINSIRESNGAVNLRDAAAAQQRGDIHNWLNGCASGEKGGTAGYGQDFSGLANYQFVLTADGKTLELPTLEATGYTFVGWYTNEKYLGEAVTTATNGLALYAKFEETKYTIEYVLGENVTNAATNPATYTFFADDIELDPAVISGDGKFIGWYSDAEFKNKVESIPAGSTGNVKLYARVLIGNVVEITFDYNNTLTADEIFNLFVADVEATSGMTGYLKNPANAWNAASEHTPLATILGWSDKDPVNGPKKAAFLAKWNWLLQAVVLDAQNTLTTSFQADVKAAMGGTVDDTGIYIISQEIKGFHEKTTAKNWYGATMYNWADDYEGLYAKVLEASKSAAKVDSYVADSEIKEVGAKDGAIFVGWYLNAEGTGDKVTKIPTADATLYAKYHSKTTLYVDPKDSTKYPTIAAALQDAFDGDVIVVEAGNYAEDLVINVNIALVGPNAEKLGTATDRADEAVISGSITFAADKISLVGFNLDGSKAWISVTKNMSGMVVNNNLMTNGSHDGVISAQTVTLTNAEFNGNYAPEWNGSRWLYLGTVNGMNFTNNKVVGKLAATATEDSALSASNVALCDIFRINNLAKGEINVTNNWLQNCFQCALFYNGVGALTLNVKDNTFKNCASACIDTRAMVASESGNCNVVQNIIHNVFDHSGYSWKVIRSRTNSFGATDSLTVEVHYNAFINGSVESGKYASNPSPSANISPVIYNMDNNYFQELKPEEVTNANFDNHASSWANCYASQAALESAWNDVTKGTLYNIVLNGKTYKVYDVIGFTLPTFDKEGNTFLGWFDGENKVEALTEMKDYTLVTKFEHGYLVSFDANGGSECEAVIFDAASDLATLPAPTKDGYTFAGWFDGENKFEATETLELKNYSLVAKWAKNFTVTYDYNGAIAGKDFEYAVGSYGFAKSYWTSSLYPSTIWFLDKAAGHLTGNYSYAYRWGLSYDETTGLFTVTDIYSFNGTLETKDLTADYVILMNGGYVDIDDFKTLAIGDKLQLSIDLSTFNADSQDVKIAKLDVGKVVESNGTLLPLDVIEGPTRAGYEFVGWMKGDTLVTKIEVAEDVTLVAKWKKESPYLYPTVEDIANEYTKDFAATTGKNTVAGNPDALDTSTIDSSDMTNMLTNKEMTAKWMWLYKALALAAENANADPEQAGFDANGNRGFYLANLYGFFAQKVHADTYLGDKSADYSKEEVVEKILAAGPLKPGAELSPKYENVSAVAEDFMADYNSKNGRTLTADQLDSSTSESSWLVAVLQDAELKAKWMWLYKALYEVAGSPEGCNPEAAETDFAGFTVKGFYLTNLNGFFTGTKHTDAAFGTSYDWTSAEDVAKVMAACPKE